MDYFDRYIQGTDTDHFKRNIPNAIGEATSLTEKVNQIIDYLHVYTELTDEMLTKWNEVYHWLKNEGLEQLVRDRLNEWLEDGTLEHLINDILSGNMKEDIDKLKKQMENLIENLNDYLERETINIKVGENETFTTINDGLNYIINKPIQPFKATITLKNNFVMKEQVSVNGKDLGYITIESEDKTKPIKIARDSITKELIESRKPAFFGDNNCVFPTINALFEYSTTNQNDGADGITVANGSKVRLIEGSGINKADRGLGAYYNSQAFSYMEGLTEGGMGKGAGDTKGVSFKDCTNRAFMSTYGSSIDCARSQLQNCSGDHTVYVIWNSTADVYQSDMSNAENTALTCRDGSIVNARETDVSNSNTGYHALHGGVINARSLTQSPWIGNSAQNCEEYAALASYGSTIELDELNANNSKKNGIHASDGSIINARGVKANNAGDLAISALRSSIINASEAEVTKPGSAGILAESSSTINADNVKANDSEDHGILARNEGHINAKNADANDCVKGFYAYNGSVIACDRSTANNCKIGYYARFGSKIDAEQAKANNCDEKGFIANEGSNINCVDSQANNINDITSGDEFNQSVGFTASRNSNVNARGCESKNCSIGVLSYEGSFVNASSTNASTSINNGFVIYRGSLLTAANSNGSMSQKEQEITQHGIIFHYTPQ